MKKRDKNYVSELDLFLEDLRQSNDLSASQEKEIAEYSRINRLRDVADISEEELI